MMTKQASSTVARILLTIVKKVYVLKERRMSVVLPDNDFYFDILENKLAMRRQDIGFITCFSIFSLFFFAPVQVSAQAIIGEAEEQLGETVGRTGVAQTDVATAAGEVVRIVL